MRFFCFCFFFPESLSAPRVTLLPSRQTVDERKDAIFNCTASGKPPAKVAWFRPNGYYGRRIRPGVQYVIRDDGTLIIKNVDYRRPTDAGRYTCVANNAVGWSSRASAYLSVRSKSYLLLLLLIRISSIAVCHSVMVVDKKNIQVHTKNWLQVRVKTALVYEPALCFCASKQCFY